MKKNILILVFSLIAVILTAAVKPWGGVDIVYTFDPSAGLNYSTAMSAGKIYFTADEASYYARVGVGSGTVSLDQAYVKLAFQNLMFYPGKKVYSNSIFQLGTNSLEDYRKHRYDGLETELDASYSLTKNFGIDAGYDFFNIGLITDPASPLNPASFYAGLGTELFDMNVLAHNITKKKFKEQEYIYGHISARARVKLPFVTVSGAFGYELFDEKSEASLISAMMCGAKLSLFNADLTAEADFTDINRLSFMVESGYTFSNGWKAGASYFDKTARDINKDGKSDTNDFPSKNTYYWTSNGASSKAAALWISGKINDVTTSLDYRYDFFNQKGKYTLKFYFKY